MVSALSTAADSPSSWVLTWHDQNATRARARRGLKDAALASEDDKSKQNVSHSRKIETPRTRPSSSSSICNPCSSPPVGSMSILEVQSPAAYKRKYSAGSPITITVWSSGGSVQTSSASANETEPLLLSSLANEHARKPVAASFSASWIAAEPERPAIGDRSLAGPGRSR